LSESGRQRLREAAIKNRPWRHSTGPRTPEGKERAAANGYRHRADPGSLRQLRVGMIDIHGMIEQMAGLRQALQGGSGDLGTAVAAP
jgi:hypothetical protein